MPYFTHPFDGCVLSNFRFAILNAVLYIFVLKFALNSLLMSMFKAAVFMLSQLIFFGGKHIE